MSAAPTDEELLAAYAAGDARAFGELYERHERPVYRYFLRQGAAAAAAGTGAYVAVRQNQGSVPAVASATPGTPADAVAAVNETEEAVIPPAVAEEPQIQVE